MDASSGKSTGSRLGDLLGTPRHRPAAVLAAPVAPSHPADVWARNGGAIRRSEHPGPPVLHVVPQGLVGGELGGLRTPGTPVDVPLRSRSPVVQPAAAGGRVAAQPPRDRRWG